MDLRQLECFVAVVEEGGFTRGARSLGTTQSAVSAAVARLERSLQAQLLERTSRALRMSPAGEALLPQARMTLAAAQSARDSVDEVSRGVRGTVRLGTLTADVLSPVSIAGILADFGRSHPDVRVALRHSSAGSAELAAQVGAGQLDLAIVVADAHGTQAIAQRDIYRQPLVLVCRPGHELAAREHVTLDQIAGLPFADGAPGWGIRAAADDAFAGGGLTRRVAYEANDNGAIVDLARHGLAVCLLPRHLADRIDGMRCVPVVPAPILRTAMAWPTMRARSAASRALELAVTEHADRLDAVSTGSPP